jgi:hypothetical protein
MATRLARIESSIVTLRGRRVILGPDLARIYGVEPRALTQAVRRNARRFPSDFAFRVTPGEHGSVLRSRSQSVILKRGQNLKYLPLAFTEHGAIMAASVLNSRRAVQMSLFVVRAFLRLRRLVAGQVELAARLSDLERRVGRHDVHLRSLIAAIRELMTPTVSEQRVIGFRPATRS